MDTDLPLLVTAPSHPSLDGAIVRFCDRLAAEPAPTGRTTAGGAGGTLARRLATAQPGLRLAAVHDGEMVGLARIDMAAATGPELLVAVGRPWRGRGVGRTLVRALLGRAHEAGIERIVVHLPRGWRPATSVAAPGFRAVDVGGGRLELLRTYVPATRTA